MPVTTHRLDDIDEVLFTEDRLASVVAELARLIERDYAPRSEPLVLIGALEGARPFLRDLSSGLNVAHEVDTITARSYGAGTRSSGCVRISNPPTMDLTAKHVLLVDDIYDTGQTLRRVMAYLERLDPLSLEACVLLRKPDDHKFQARIRYVGLEAPNRFLIGYGLDYAGRYRDLPYVAVLGDGHKAV